MIWQPVKWKISQSSVISDVGVQSEGNWKISHRKENFNPVRKPSPQVPSTLSWGCSLWSESAGLSPTTHDILDVQCTHSPIRHMIRSYFWMSTGICILESSNVWAGLIWSSWHLSLAPAIPDQPCLLSLGDHEGPLLISGKLIYRMYVIIAWHHIFFLLPFLYSYKVFSGWRCYSGAYTCPPRSRNWDFMILSQCDGQGPAPTRFLAILDSYGCCNKWSQT